MAAAIVERRNARRPIWVTSSNVAASEGKKTGEGTMMSAPEPAGNPVTVADPPEAQTKTPATTQVVSDIRKTGKIQY
jgi:hypothetical protein